MKPTDHHLSALRRFLPFATLEAIAAPGIDAALVFGVRAEQSARDHISAIFVLRIDRVVLAGMNDDDRALLAPLLGAE